MFTVDGQVVMLTGAVGRLGSATARLLQQHGARTVLIDRQQARLNSVYADLADAPDHLLAGGVDLATGNGLAAAVSQALERFGRIDALVNTVGAYRGGKPACEEDDETWQLMFDVNVKTALNACRAVAPVMLGQRRGRIVNVASRAALAGAGGLAAYCASKSAVVRLTESLSADLKHAGVNVNCVLPGTLDTPENRKAMPDADSATWVTLDAVACVIAFLTSDGASAIHGAAIPVYRSA
ncbi:MAG: SDR family NAD(P)-dependent oxidoreductase [Phycisphaerales bacterium]|nr:MAG: SDR family NAD(P)-dependent oxidoreductase [Phycisphaerales bacterium]